MLGSSQKIKGVKLNYSDVENSKNIKRLFAGVPQ